MTPYRAALALFALLFLPPVAAAVPEGKIIIAQGVDPTTLDPQWHEETPAYNVLLNVYDTLLFRDKDLKIIPWLAESWKLVNPTTWEFKIRKGVKFHNGEEVDADAVKFSLDRIRDPELKARQSVYFRLVTSVDVVDKHTVRVLTSRPYPTLENHLALRGAIMPPGHFRGKEKVFADRNPVGSGPYKFVRWVKDEQIELEANPSWWGGAPKIKTIVFRPIPEHAVRVAALQAGEIDIAVNIPPHLVQIIEKHPKLYTSKAQRPHDLYPDLRVPVRHREQARGPRGGPDAGQARAAGATRCRQRRGDHQHGARGQRRPHGDAADAEALRLRPHVCADEA
jgi:peptide/nickel transport system substrate-binding protein